MGKSSISKLLTFLLVLIISIASYGRVTPGVPDNRFGSQDRSGAAQPPVDSSAQSFNPAPQRIEVTGTRDTVSPYELKVKPVSEEGGLNYPGETKANNFGDHSGPLKFGESRGTSDMPLKLDNSGSSTAPAGGAGVSGHAAKTDFEITQARDKSNVGRAEKFCAEIQAVVPKASTVVAQIHSQLLPLCQKLVTTDASCQSIFGGDWGINTMCHTQNNESIASSITMIQTLMGVAQGVTNACNNFGKAMDIAKKAMAAYTTACGAAQVACSSRCGAAATALKAFVGSSKKAKAEMPNCFLEVKGLKSNQMTVAAGIAADEECTKLQAAITKALAIAERDMDPASSPSGNISKAKICTVSVPALLGSAIINLGTLAQSKAQADQCKADAEAKKKGEEFAKSCDNDANKDRTDCACSLEANKNLTRCKAIAANLTDCALEANADKPMCICRANPRLKGCAGVSTAMTTFSSLNSGKGGGLSSGRGPSNVNVGAGPTAAADGTGTAANNKKGNGTDGSSASGHGGGGSSAGLGGGGGDSTSAAKDADSAAGGKDSAANVLDSSGGGGGGSGYRYSGGMGDYNSADYRSRLKAFAAKNGIGAKIAGNSWSDQVTVGGGKSNFEKIKARYQENKSTLLGGR